MRWGFCHGLNDYYEMEEGGLKTFVFDNIYARTCKGGACHAADPNPLKAGYMKPTACKCWPLSVYNPVGDRLERAKELVKYDMEYLIKKKV